MYPLPPRHAPPAEKTVEVVDQECSKADGHGKVCRIFCRGQKPQGDQDAVVCGVGQRIIRAPAAGEIDRGKAGGDGHGAENQIRRVQRAG